MANDGKSAFGFIGTGDYTPFDVSEASVSHRSTTAFGEENFNEDDVELNARYLDEVDPVWAAETLKSLGKQLKVIKFPSGNDYNQDLIEARAEYGHLEREFEETGKLSMGNIFLLVQIVDMLKEAEAALKNKK